MLACYPELFAAGAIIAGLLSGAAENVQQALQSMSQSPSRPAQEWGDLVRHAAPGHNGPWPRISIWHGRADTTVIPSNAREILKQWTAVHGLPPAPSVQTEVDGHPRAVWLNDAGEEAIESYRHHQHGAWHAAGDRRRRVSRAARLDRSCSRLESPPRTCHRPVFRADRGGRASGCAADKWHRHRQEAAQ